MLALTRDMSRGCELGSEGRIHCDHQLALLRHQGVAILDLLSNPSPEGITEDSSADVHNPLLGDLREVWLVREVVGQVALAAHILEDLLQGEILVLRDVERLHLAVQDVALLASQEVLQVVDGSVVCRKERC